MERRFITFTAACVVLTLGTLGVSSSRAAQYEYSAQLGTLPAAQGWSETHYAGSPFFSTSTQQIVGGNTLVVHDTDSSVPGYEYGTSHSGVTIANTDGWQER